MANRTRLAAIIITGAGGLALCGAALAQTSGASAQTPTQSDFDQCNREAQLTGGSASPRGSAGAGSATGGTLTSGSTATTPSGSPDTTASGSTGAGTSAAGATGGTGSVSGGSTLGTAGTGTTGTGTASGGATSGGGALHRALLNLRAAVTGRDEVAVLDEAERGEHAALRAYREALAVRELPADVRSVIAHHAARIKETYDCLRDLKRAA